MLAATAQAAEVSELNRKLQVSDEEIDRINRRFDETQCMHIMFTKEVIFILEVICIFRG